MKIPAKLKIGGHLITVAIRPLDKDQAEWDPNTNTISILDSLPQSQKESALLHEILHALNAVLGDEGLGHMLLDSLSEQLYQVLSDNKMLR